MGEQLHAVLPRRIEQVGFEVEALLGHAQRLRAVALDGLAPHEGFGEQILLRHAFVDEADLDRLFRGEAAGAEDHLAGEALADDARQVLRRADRRAGADLGAGLAEHGVFGRDHEVAPQGELVTAAHAPAVDHRDDRNRQAADRHGEALHAVVPHGGIGPVEPLHGVEIAARRERLVADAGDHRAGDRGIVAGRLQRVDHLVERLLAERVEHARPVDGDPRHLVFHLVEDVLVAARGCETSPVGPAGLFAFRFPRHVLSRRSAAAAFLCAQRVPIAAALYGRAARATSGRPGVPPPTRLSGARASANPESRGWSRHHFTVIARLDRAIQ